MEQAVNAYIFNKEGSKIVLVMHEKYNKLLPPGGHVEPNETILEACIREVAEETGIKLSYSNFYSLHPENKFVLPPNSVSDHPHIVSEFLAQIDESSYSGKWHRVDTETFNKLDDNVILTLLKFRGELLSGINIDYRRACHA